MLLKFKTSMLPNQKTSPNKGHLRAVFLLNQVHGKGKALIYYHQRSHHLKSGDQAKKNPQVI